MKYYVVINDKEYGPFSMDQLSGLDITPDTEVWAQGMDDWMLAGDVPELMPLLERNALKAAPAPTYNERHRGPQPSRVRNDYVQEEMYERPRKRRGGCLLWFLVILFVLLISSASTVPNTRDHLDAIYKVTGEWMNEKVDGTVGKNYLGDVAKIVGKQATDLAVRKMFKCKNYFFVSVGYFDYGEGAKPVSLGVFGHVFTISKDDINKAFNKVADSLRGLLEEKLSKQDGPPQEITVSPPGNSDGGGSRDPAVEYLDTTINRIKNKVVHDAKEWVKQQIDDL